MPLVITKGINTILENAGSMFCYQYSLISKKSNVFVRNVDFFAFLCYNFHNPLLRQSVREGMNYSGSKLQQSLEITYR